MASIPLPALNIKPPQEQAGPLQQYAQVLGIKNAQQEQQVRAQQIQAGNMENQQRQIALQSQQSMQKAWMEAKGDPEQTVTLAKKYGVLPQTVQSFQSGLLDQQQKYATLGKDQQALFDAKTKAADESATKILSAAPPDRPAVYAAERARLLQSGVATPDQLPEQYPGDQFVQTHAYSANMATKVAAEAKKSLTDAQASATAAQQKALELAGTNPQGMTAAQQSEANSRKQNLQVEQGKLAEEKRYHDLQAGIGGVTTAGGVTGPAQITQVPDAIRGTVQGILDYRQNMPPMTRSNPRNSMIQYWVNKLDPNYDASQFPARNKLIAGYTSGPQSKEINAINTAMGHVGVLGDALKALDNGDVKVINSIANNLGIQVGQTPAATVNLIVHRVGPELTAAYVQGGGGEADRGTTASDFDTSLGKDILKANVGTTATLLRSKIGSLENQYKQTVKRDDFQQRFITPEAQAALDKYSPKGPPSGANGGQQHAPGTIAGDQPAASADPFAAFGGAAHK